MNKKVVFLITTLMITVSLSGCLGRGGGNGENDKNMGSPEEVRLKITTFFTSATASDEFLLKHFWIMHTPQGSPITRSTSK